MMTHGVRLDCCLTNNSYFVYWRSHSARNEPHRWRWFFYKNPNHYQVVVQPNSRTYDASGGQAASVLASIWFCKDVGQNYFEKFATTDMPNAWEWRVRDTFGLSSTEALAAAIFSKLRALLCLTGTRTFCTVPVDSNFSIRRSIVDLLGRLHDHKMDVVFLMLRPLSPNFGSNF